MVVPIFIYNIITVDFYQLWLNFNVTSTKNIDVISTTLFRSFFDVASNKIMDVISTTLFRRLIDVVLRVMTSWRHSNVYSTSYRRHVPTGTYFLTSWQTFHTICTLHSFYRTFFTYFPYFCMAVLYFLISWRMFWRYDILSDVMTYFLVSYKHFDVMAYFLILWHNIWRHNVLFDIMIWFLTSWRTFYVMTYL